MQQKKLIAVPKKIVKFVSFQGFCRTPQAERRQSEGTDDLRVDDI